MSVYRVKKLFPEVTPIRNAGVNMYLIEGEKRSLLFDTGYGFLSLKDLVSSLMR